MQHKVLFIYNNSFGQYPILYEYCINVFASGYDVYYIGVSAKDEEFISAEGIKVLHLSKTENSGAWKLNVSISKHIKKIQPDLVHTFHFRWCFPVPIMSGTFYKSILDVRTLHVANKQGKHSSLTFLKNRITWLESQFFRNAIALTTDIKKILSPSYKKIPVFPLGANVAKLQPADKAEKRLRLREKLQIQETDKVFIYSGTLSPARKIEVILHAFIQISEPSSWLIVAGDDKDDAQSLINLKQLAANSKVNRQIIFTGFIDYNKLVDYYLCSDIGLCYVPQTKYYDLQPPTKLFEYMAAGLVTIATRTSANMAIITNERSGYLTNDNIEELSQTLMETTANYDRTSKNIKENAFILVQNYSWEHIIRTFILPYYNRILNK